MIDYNAIPDEDLYGMCVVGDEGAWCYVYNYILVICRWKKWDLRVEPEDLAQQIVLHLIEKALKQVKEKSKFRNFVKKAAINKIKDSFRLKIVHVQSIERSVKTKNGEEIAVDPVDPKPSHENAFMDLEMVSIIDAAILKLPVPCQRVLQEYLKFKMGLYGNYGELSRVLKMHIPTISSRVTRCLNKLLALKEIKELIES